MPVLILVLYASGSRNKGQSLQKGTLPVDMVRPPPPPAQRYLHSVHGPALVQRIEACRAQLEAHRRNNFTGAMLRHHQHKSTQYMSQWIEAKNRLVPA